MATTKELRIVYLDIFACRTEEEFCNAFATAVLKQTSTRAEEWLRNIQDFLSRVSPRVTLGVDPTAEMSLSIDLRGVERGQSMITTKFTWLKSVISAYTRFAS